MNRQESKYFISPLSGIRYPLSVIRCTRPVLIRRPGVNADQADTDSDHLGRIRNGAPQNGNKCKS